MSQRPAVYRKSDATYVRRANTDGKAGLGWMGEDAPGRTLLSGHAFWDRADAPPKTLDYEEVILVLSGRFGVQLEDGTRLSGNAGDVLHIPCGATVRYEGEDAQIFFVVTSGPVAIDDVR